MEGWEYLTKAANALRNQLAILINAVGDSITKEEADSFLKHYRKFEIAMQDFRSEMQRTEGREDDSRRDDSQGNEAV